MGEIMIPCEGSNSPGHGVGLESWHMCKMCGVLLPSDGGQMSFHKRQDILAMIDRGDFDG